MSVAVLEHVGPWSEDEYFDGQHYVERAVAKDGEMLTADGPFAIEIDTRALPRGPVAMVVVVTIAPVRPPAPEHEIQRSGPTWSAGSGYAVGG